ncbi:hypothetical protein HMPREF0620_1362 [Parascardovia denticolens DSM 10105 = JCM 12538]|uniref:Transposase IS204/IS1001/IS1096/IS1165 DDE domain-containing protein n=1 Tax=Parascardovia denticolens DSM 10105 = JCM 12538 TaxID=864564 RepID=E6K2X3_PARDN|nr:hypothetical protein HMPREF0620_1362 [Parascardovia denticolens DSM 10105 = JCM 12538]
MIIRKACGFLDAQNMLDMMHLVRSDSPAPLPDQRSKQLNPHEY